MRLALKVAVGFLALVGVLAIVGVIAALVGDGAARTWAETQAANKIDASLPGAHAQVQIDSSPFLGHLILQGKVSHIIADVSGVNVGPLRLAHVGLAVDGLTINRADAVMHQKLGVKGITKARFFADVTQSEIDRLSGLPLVLGHGGVSLTVLGVTLNGHMSLSRHDLRLTGLGQSIDISVPTLAVLPCVPALTVVPGRVDMACSTTSVPSVLLAKFGMLG